MTIKIYRRLLIGLSFSAALISCAFDDSAIADELIPGITIGELSENGFTVVSFEGNRLEVTANVTTTYPENELTYNWYLIDVAQEGVYHGTDTDYHFDRQQIGTGRTLSYEVNLSPGEYTLVLEVTAANGYTVTKTATLNAVTNFTQGFYILKETDEGKTELDLLNNSDGEFMQNLLTNVHGSPLPAAPQNLSTAYAHCYIDTERNEPASANLVTVTTQDGRIWAMRTSDLKPVLDNDNLLFTEMGAEEQPYRIVSGYFGNYLISDQGIRYQWNATMTSKGSGKYGITSEIAATPHICYDNSSGNLFFWDDQSHSIATCDYNGTASFVEDEHYKVTGLARMTCSAVGYNAATGYIVFVLSTLDGSQKQLVLLTSGFGAGASVESMRALRVNKLNSASTFSVAYYSAALLYGVVDNKIYGLDLNSYTEQEITAHGIGDDEQIVYISNQCEASGLFDYFVIGTKKGSNYTLRFYQLLGGQPDGDPVYTLHGTGTPRAIHYIDNATQHFGVAPLQD